MSRGLHAGPFKYDIVDITQAGCLLQLLLTYLTAFIFLDDGADDRVRSDLDNDLTLGIVLIAINCFAFVILFVVMAYEIFRTRQAAQARRLRFNDKDRQFVTTGDFRYKLADVSPMANLRDTAVNIGKNLKNVAQPRPSRARSFRASKAEAKGSFHIFLSHVWSTGQDTMRIVKERLQEMVPGLLCFLDVDNLTQGKGAESVDASCVCLIFCTRGYFQSPNCMRELLRAFCVEKPQVTLLEPDLNKGRLTRADIKAQLIEADGRYATWGLAKEVAEWGHELPSAQQLYDYLFPEGVHPIEWDRIAAFQNVTLCNIASSLLEPDRSIFLQTRGLKKKAHLPAPRGMTSGKKFHLFCSEHNPGAEALVELLCDCAAAGKHARKRKGLSITHSSKKLDDRLIQTTSDPVKLKGCERMLIYLTAKTWTGDDTLRIQAFVKEVASAMALGVELFLVHECPGDDTYTHQSLVDSGAAPDDSQVRSACDFGDFFKYTPAPLLEAGIYSQIAKVAKGGRLRDLSLELLFRALCEYHGRKDHVVVSGVPLDPNVVPHAFLNEEAPADSLDPPPDEELLEQLGNAGVESYVGAEAEAELPEPSPLLAPTYSAAPPQGSTITAGSVALDVATSTVTPTQSQPGASGTAVEQSPGAPGSDKESGDLSAKIKGLFSFKRDSSTEAPAPAPHAATTADTETSPEARGFASSLAATRRVNEDISSPDLAA